MAQDEAQLVFEYSGDAIIVCTDDGLINRLNGAARSLLGLTGIEAQGQELASLMPEPDQWKSLFAMPLQARENQLQVLPRGADHFVSARVRSVPHEIDQVYVFLDQAAAVRHDPAAPLPMPLDAERLRFVIDTIPALVAYVDSQHHCRFVNRPCQKWLDLTPAEVIGQPIADVLGEAANQVLPWADAALKGQHVREEMQVDYPSGSRFVRLTLTPDARADGKVRGYVALVEDLSEQKALEMALRDREAQSRHLAYHDTLTKLPNRARFNEQLAAAIQRGEEHENQRIALMFVDIDGFKDINDTYGHDAGDAVLKVVARRLRGCARRIDTVGRYAGDEFLLIAEELKKREDADQFARRIMAAVAQPITYDEHMLEISVSIGIAVFRDDANDAQDLLRKADHAMYEAKRAGKNQFRRYSDDSADK